MSLAAHCITARMTNWFTQTGLSTCDLHQLFTRLWWWLSLRLLKWQSPLLTRVLPRTTLTQTIRLHYEMFPPLSNHLLYHGDFTFHWEFFSFIDISMMNSTFCTKKGKYFSKSACFILMWKLKLCELSLHAGDLVCIQSS